MKLAAAATSSITSTTPPYTSGSRADSWKRSGSILLAAVGVVLGLGAATAVTRLMTSLLFDVRPLDAPTYVAVAVLLTAVAALASWLPARRAARVDPLVALRAE